MKLREALIQQAPSLELQRAAAAEIAKLDSVMARVRTLVLSSLRTQSRDVNDWHESTVALLEALNAVAPK